MSYDLNILVLDQEEPSELPFNSSIEYKHEGHEKLRYGYMWHYMTHTRGMWYYLGKKDEIGFVHAYDICTGRFDIDEANIQMPYWIQDDDVKHNLVPLIILDEYINDFKKIVSFLSDQSPIKTVMLLARFQGGEHEIVCGVLSLNEFLDLLENKQILFNVCYIIKNT